MFFGYFDPENSFIDYKNINIFWGELTDMKAKNEALQNTGVLQLLRCKYMKRLFVCAM